MKKLLYLLPCLFLLSTCNQLESDFKHHVESSLTKASYSMYKRHLTAETKSTEKLTEVFKSDWNKIRLDQPLIDDIASALQNDYHFQVRKNIHTSTSSIYKNKKTTTTKRSFDQLKFIGKFPKEFITSYNQRQAIELVYLDSKILNEEGAQLDSTTNSARNTKDPRYFTSRGNITGSRTISNYYNSIHGHFKLQLRGVKKYHIATLKRDTKEFTLGDKKYKVLHFSENSIFVLPLDQTDIKDLRNIERLGVTTDGYSTSGASTYFNLSWSICELFIKNNTITKEEFEKKIEAMDRSEIKQKGLSVNFRYPLDEVILYRPAEYYTSNELTFEIKDVVIK